MKVKISNNLMDGYKWWKKNQIFHDSILAGFKVEQSKYTVDRFKSECGSDGYEVCIFSVYNKGGLILKIFKGERYGTLGVLSTLFVEEKYRNNGVFKSLMDEVKKYLILNNIHILDVGLDYRNLVALNSYLHVGFKPTAIQMTMWINQKDG